MLLMRQSSGIRIRKGVRRIVNQAGVILRGTALVLVIAVLPLDACGINCRGIRKFSITAFEYVEILSRIVDGRTTGSSRVVKVHYRGPRKTLAHGGVLEPGSAYVIKFARSAEQEAR